MHDVDTETRYDALRSAEAPRGKRLDHFGRDPTGYDLGGPDGTGPDESLADPDYGDSAPGEYLVRRCLITWARLWQRYDIITAAHVFHVEHSLLEQIGIQPPDYSGLQVVTDDLGCTIQFLASQQTHYADAECVRGNPWFPTCAEVGAWLNLAEATVKDVVVQHPWMFLGGERAGSREIEHDGE